SLLTCSAPTRFSTLSLHDALPISSDVMIVFSAGGLTAVPIEIARGARAQGLTVVAVTSVRQSFAGTPTHSSGTRLIDQADVVLRSEEHTSELQSRVDLVCRLLLGK